MVKEASAYGSQPYRRHVTIVFKSGILNLLEFSGPVLGMDRDYFSLNFIENFILTSGFDISSVSRNNA